MRTPARVRCDCGFEILSTELDDLVTRAREHARCEHDMDVPVERILAIVEPREVTFAPPPGVRPLGRGTDRA